MAIPTHNWHEQILKEFTPHVAKLTLVADPDNLLTEELLLLDIQARGFELFHFEDPITFRFAYESKYRDRMEGGDLSLVVILTEHELRLPYDLLQIGRQLSFSLQDLFPNLSYPVIKALDSSDLESLSTNSARMARTDHWAITSRFYAQRDPSRLGRSPQR